MVVSQKGGNSKCYGTIQEDTLVLEITEGLTEEVTFKEDLLKSLVSHGEE